MAISQRFATLPPLSLYVHIPWCVRKCPYCDFNSHQAATPLPEANYVDELIADLERDASYAQGRRLHSIFIGGGTPSLFSAEALQRLLGHCETLLGFEDEIEITLEANPGTVEQQRFCDYRAIGINRLSIGIQSLQDKHLQRLGRIHSAHEAVAAVAAAREAGFDNINLDLMHGLPDQSVDEALADLAQLTALTPEHISWYQLTIEPNTVFYRNPPPLPNDDTLAAIEEQGQELLAQAGYEQYEVSAYAKPTYSARHNCNYWEFGDYFGIGAGAHGKVTALNEQRILRSQKTRLPQHYLNRETVPISPWSVVAAENLPLEFMMNALRLNQGMLSKEFETRTGMALEHIAPQIEKLRHRELLVDDESLLKTTSLGRRFLNDVLDHFLTWKF